MYAVASAPKDLHLLENIQREGLRPTQVPSAAVPV